MQGNKPKITPELVRQALDTFSENLDRALPNASEYEDTNALAYLNNLVEHRDWLKTIFYPEQKETNETA